MGTNRWQQQPLGISRYQQQSIGIKRCQWNRMEVAITWEQWVPKHEKTRTSFTFKAVLAPTHKQKREHTFTCLGFLLPESILVSCLSETD